MKIGRNDPCPCGSGKKFKRCHLGGQPVVRPAPRTIPKEVLAKFQHMQREQMEHVARYGHVRPPITADYMGHKFVAVGSHLHYSKEWKFVPDFLMAYLLGILGKEWGEAELRKPPSEQHPIIQMRTKAILYMNRQERNDKGFFDVRPSGPMAGFLSLAYDLYVVQDNSRLDDDLLDRLRHPDQYQGARHELFAEATCLRAGCRISHENRADPSTRHAEFIATHIATGQVFSVEAKSKHSAGETLNSSQPVSTGKPVGMRFGRLLEGAIRKNPPHPLVVFMDTNTPPGLADRFYDPESVSPFVPSRRLMGLLEGVKKRHGNMDPYCLIVFSNRPFHYTPEDEPAPPTWVLSVIPQHPRSPAQHFPAVWAIHEAAQLAGNIPNEFPPL